MFLQLICAPVTKCVAVPTGTALPQLHADPDLCLSTHTPATRRLIRRRSILVTVGCSRFVITNASARHTLRGSGGRQWRCMHAGANLVRHGAPLPRQIFNGSHVRTAEQMWTTSTRTTAPDTCRAAPTPSTRPVRARLPYGTSGCVAFREISSAPPQTQAWRMLTVCSPAERRTARW